MAQTWNPWLATDTSVTDGARRERTSGEPFPSDEASDGTAAWTGRGCAFEARGNGTCHQHTLQVGRPRGFNARAVASQDGRSHDSDARARAETRPHQKERIAPDIDTLKSGCQASQGFLPPLSHLPSGAGFGGSCLLRETSWSPFRHRSVSIRPICFSLSPISALHRLS
jgi:hypothetical protein